MPDSLNRTLAPLAASFRHIPLPHVQTLQLRNGIPVYVLPYGTAPVVEVQALFGGGTNYQDRAGIAQFCLQNMVNASKTHNSLELAQILDGYGAWMGQQAGEESLSVSLATTSKNLEHTLHVLKEVILEPAFSEEEFSSMKARNLQKLHVAEQKTSNIATRHFRKHMFGEQHPYGYYFGSDELQGVGLPELQAFYHRYIFPGNMCLLLTGNFDQAEIMELLEKEFGDLDMAEKPSLVSPSELGQTQKGRFYVPHEGMQSSLRLGQKGISRSHEDYYAMQVVNTIFGGYFGSRLMRNIREEKGYTYGIYSGFVGLKHTGVFVIQTDVGNEYVEATIAEVKQEMEALCEKGVSGAELDLVKNYMLGQGISRRETLFQLGDTLRFSLSQGISFEEIDRKFSVITQIRPEDIQALAQKYFQADQLLEVVVGDVAPTS